MADAMDDTLRDFLRDMGALFLLPVTFRAWNVNAGHVPMIRRNPHGSVNVNSENSKYIRKPAVHQNVVHIR
jgi:hypothetical protein